MDPLSIATSAVGLAGAFNTCMQCFEYVQLGRGFGEDSGKCTLQLDVVRLRMSRWGTAAGLSPGFRRFQPATVSREEYEVAQDLLEQIQALLQSVEERSKSYKKMKALRQSSTTDLEVFDPTTDLTATCGNAYASAHRNLRQIATQRQAGTSLLQKTKWALYGKSRFHGLIQDLTGFVESLIELFPLTQEQNVLCKQEVFGIDGLEELKLVDAANAGSDTLLQNAVRQELASRGNSATDFNMGEDTSFRMGDVNMGGVEGAPNAAKGFTMTGRANVSIGNEMRSQDTTSSPRPGIYWKSTAI